MKSIEKNSKNKVRIARLCESNNILEGHTVLVASEDVNNRYKEYLALDCGTHPETGDRFGMIIGGWQVAAGQRRKPLKQGYGEYIEIR